MAGVGAPLRELNGHSSYVRSVSFSPDGARLASASDDNTVRLWNVASGWLIATLLAAPEGWVAFLPDGRYNMQGDMAGRFWHMIGLCRFEPGELDPYLDLVLPLDAPLADGAVSL